MKSAQEVVDRFVPENIDRLWIDRTQLVAWVENIQTDARAELLDRITELEGHKTDFINRGKRLDEAEQQLNEAVEFAEGVLQVCEFLDNSDNHYTKHTQEHLAKLNAFLASQKDAK